VVANCGHYQCCYIR